jgi:hypothetical protein
MLSISNRFGYRRCAALALLVLGVAVARPREAGADPVGAAKVRFDNGKRFFRLGDYDLAIKEWRQGYLVKDDPVFLFNIAQAYRELKDFEDAIKFYENYLREARNATNRDTVESRIAEMKEELRKREEASRAPPNGPIDPEHQSGSATAGGHSQDGGTAPGALSGQPDRIPNPNANASASRVSDGGGDAPRPGKSLRTAGLVTGGVGVALVVTGIVFALKASAANAEVQNAIDSGGSWTQDLRDKDSAGRTANAVGMVALGVGAAAVVGGGVLYLWGRSRDRDGERPAGRTAAIVPDLGPTQAGIRLRVEF